QRQRELADVRRESQRDLLGPLHGARQFRRLGRGRRELLATAPLVTQPRESALRVQAQGGLVASAVSLERGLGAQQLQAARRIQQRRQRLDGTALLCGCERLLKRRDQLWTWRRGGPRLARTTLGERGQDLGGGRDGAGRLCRQGLAEDARGTRDLRVIAQQSQRGLAHGGLFGVGEALPRTQARPAERRSIERSDP